MRCNAFNAILFLNKKNEYKNKDIAHPKVSAIKKRRHVQPLKIDKIPKLKKYSTM
jgi:hypothetical protein